MLPMTQRVVFAKKTVALDAVTGQPAVVRSARDLEDACVRQSSSFVPHRSMRGKIARCAAYIMASNPELARSVHENVLDVHTMIMWHHQQPVSSWELELDAFIESEQGTHNSLIRRPESIWEVLYLGGIRVDGSMFNSFDYGAHFTSEEAPGTPGRQPTERTA